jgi:phage tail sheath protein FI
MQSGAGNYAVDNVNDGSSLIQLTRLSTPSDVTRPAANGLLGGDTSGAELNPGDAFEIVVNGGVPKTAVLSITAPVTALADIARTLQAAIRGVDPSDTILAGATVQLAGNRLHVAAGRGGAVFDSETVIELADSSGTPISGAALDATSAVANLQQYALGSTANVGAQGGGVVGTDGGPPDATALEGSRRPERSGMYALDEVDTFNILCLPRAAELYEIDRNQAALVIGAAESYCEKRRAFLIVDLPPSVNNVQDATDWLNEMATLRHRNAAAYFPRPLIPDPLNEHRLRGVGASGTVAGIYARTDTTRGVWKAPAGIEAGMRNVQDLEYQLSGQENGLINPLGLNALRNFDTRGIVVWGARTLKGVDNQPSEWKYVPVRRTALFIEESLYRGTQWAVFEANGEPLWSQLRLNIGAFMQRLFRQGTFQGTTPTEAYFVKIDSETTTPADINLGIVNIHVGFAPLRPAEFIIIKIQQKAGSSAA